MRRLGGVVMGEMKRIEPLSGWSKESAVSTGTKSHVRGSLQRAALGLEFFRRVTTPRTHAEAKELADALSSWEAFGEALWRAYGDPPRSNHGVPGVRAALRSDLGAGQRLVGADRADREAIGIELEDDDGADGLTEDWSEAGRVCRRMDDERACRSGRKTRDGAPSQRKRARGKGKRRGSVSELAPKKRKRP
jgi:hypothetical protein